MTNPRYALAVMAGILSLSLSVSWSIANPLPLVAEQERALVPGGHFKECETCPDMVVVPPGEFLMGASRDEKIPFANPQRKVHLSARFAVSKTEISVEQYGAFIRAAGHSPKPGCQQLADALKGTVNRRDNLSWRDPGFPQGPSSPVTCVTWEDAKSYVAWLARTTGKPYRLLSEAEWEYAARARTTTPYHFGANAGDACLYGNGADRTFQRTSARFGFPPEANDLPCSDNHMHTAPVGSLKANPFGLHDMHGNISEWVEDCSVMFETGRGYDGAPTDGSAWIVGRCMSRVTRGGHWGSPAKELQAKFRSEGAANGPTDVVGIRVARSLSP